MLTGLVETVLDRLRVGRATQHHGFLEQRAVRDSRPRYLGEIQLLVGEIQLQEEIRWPELATEIGPPDHVEAGSLPGALRILAAGRFPDERSQQAKEVGGRTNARDSQSRYFLSE